MPVDLKLKKKKSDRYFSQEKQGSRMSCFRGGLGGQWKWSSTGILPNLTSNSLTQLHLIHASTCIHEDCILKRFHRLFCCLLFWCNNTSSTLFSLVPYLWRLNAIPRRKRTGLTISHRESFHSCYYKQHHLFLYRFMQSCWYIFK